MVLAKYLTKYKIKLKTLITAENKYFEHLNDALKIE